MAQNSLKVEQHLSPGVMTLMGKKMYEGRLTLTVAICTEAHENKPAGYFHGIRRNRLYDRQRLFARNSVQVVTGSFQYLFYTHFHFISFIYFGMSKSLEQNTYLHINTHGTLYCKY